MSDTTHQAAIIEMHKTLAQYHRTIADEARLDVFHEYHERLADLLEAEVTRLAQAIGTGPK